MSYNEVLKEYWRGYRAADADIYACGLSYAQRQHDYGLNGVSDTYARGYLTKVRKARERLKRAEQRLEIEAGE